MSEGILLPNWLGRVPPEQRKQAALRFLLRAAALYATEHGTVGELSVLCGYGRSTLSVVGCRDFMSHEMARNIERHAGRALFPRELLAPHVYADAER
jgi:hypothetical protein